MQFRGTTREAERAAGDSAVPWAAPRVCGEDGANLGGVPWADMDRE